jgi:putative peptidoglycan lipid II flippase
MSRLFGAGDIEGLKQRLVSAMRQIFFFALPASLGLGILARPIVRSILELGSFNEKSTDLVSHSLVFFSIGLVGYGIVEIITRAFYAMQNTRTPVIVAILTIGLNIILSLLLIGPLGHGGLALSLAITNTLEMLLLLWLIQRRLGALDGENSRLWLTAVKIALAADFMGCFLLAANWILAQPFASLSKLPLILLTGLVIGLAGAIYAGLAWLLKIEELQSALGRFIRRRTH